MKVRPPPRQRRGQRIYAETKPRRASSFGHAKEKPSQGEITRWSGGRDEAGKLNPNRSQGWRPRAVGKWAGTSQADGEERGHEGERHLGAFSRNARREEEGRIRARPDCLVLRSRRRRPLEGWGLQSKCHPSRKPAQSRVLGSASRKRRSLCQPRSKVRRDARDRMLRGVDIPTRVKSRSAQG